jgi:hypothetical protein
MDMNSWMFRRKYFRMEEAISVDQHSNIRQGVETTGLGLFHGVAVPV